MHHITQRLSPSLIVAVAALFVALAGTAAAAIIITSPDQLADDVVTQPKIKEGAVGQAQQQRPILRAYVGAEGTLSSDAHDANTVRLMPESAQVPFRSYKVTFSTVGLQGKPGVKDLRDCVFSATTEPRILFDPPAVARAADLQVMRPTLSEPNTVAVLVSEKQPNGSLKAVQRAFHLIAAC